VANAIQEQFLKLGLGDEKKISKTQHEKHKQDNKVRHGNKPADDSGKRQAQQAQAQKAERDRLLNEQRKADADKKAAAAQIKQLVAEHRQPKEQGEGGVPYNFTDGSRIRRIYISAALRAQITRGVMAIVKSAGQYEVVPAEIAEKIRQRNERCVVQLSTELPPSSEAADDPYAAYQVPDDLIW